MKQKIIPFLTLLTACQDWDYERVSFLQVKTGEAVEITANTAQLKGTLFGLTENETVSQYGHVWSATTETPTLENNEKATSLGRQGDIGFQSTADGLRPNTLYYYRAYGLFREEVIYGEVDTFSTRNFLVVIDDVEVTGEEAVVNWRVVSFLGDPEKLGVVWSATNETPTLASTDVKRTEQSSPFLNCTTPCPISESIAGLETNTNFYVRAYLLPGDGRAPVYSEVVHFHTFPQPAGWTRLQDFPGGERIGQYVQPVEGKVYLGGGRGNNNDAWEYDPEVDIWNPSGAFPYKQYNRLIYGNNLFNYSFVPSYFSIGKKIFMGVPADTIMVYVAPGNQGGEVGGWTTMIRALPQPFSEGRAIASFAIRETGYVVVNTKENEGTIWAFRLQNNSSYAVEKVLSFTTPFLDRKQGLFFPDYNVNRNLVADVKAFLFLPDECWEFDPDAPKESALRQLDRFPEYWPKAIFPANGRIYAGMGYLSPTLTNLELIIREGLDPTNHFWELDPQLPPGQQWRRMPDFPGPKGGTRSSFSVMDRGYVGITFPYNRLGPPNPYYDPAMWQFTPPE